MGQVNNLIKTAKFVSSQEGETFSMMGMNITPKVVADDTGGFLSLIEQTVKPGAGSSPHLLHYENKVIYVVEGKFAIQLGDEIQTATPGSCAVVPKGTLHSFKNIGTEEGRIIICLFPGGHERFLRVLSENNSTRQRPEGAQAELLAAPAAAWISA